MAVVVKAMHTANMHNILLENLLNDVSNVLERFGVMDTQAIDVVTFDLRVLVFSELSAAQLVIKLILFRCITFLNNNSL